MKKVKLTTYIVQSKAPGGKWKNRYAPFDNKAQASVYYNGTCAHNGHKCRLIIKGKIIESKGE